MAREISLASLSLLPIAPPEVVHLAADAGFDSIGLRVGAVAGGVDHRLIGNSPVRRTTKAALASTGITVLDAEIMILRPPGCEKVDPEPILEATADLGCRNMAVISFDSDRQRTRDSLARLCERAAAYSIACSLEFMNFTAVRSIAEALETIRGVGQPNCGLLLDTLHLFRTGGGAKEIDDLPPELLHFSQISDATPGGPQADPDLAADEARHHRSVPGEGDLPLADVVTRLPPDLPLSVEVPIEQGVDPAVHARQLFDGAQRLLARTDP